MVKRFVKKRESLSNKIKEFFFYRKGGRTIANIFTKKLKSAGEYRKAAIICKIAQVRGISA